MPDSDWLSSFRSETAPVIDEPFWRCLAEAVAIVESDHGRRALRAPAGLNEVGYKAVPGRPALRAATREAAPDGSLAPARADFRLFRDRAEQACALLHLFRSSVYYESARLLFVLAFYCAYAPGRAAGARALVQVFNELARSGAHPGVRPFTLTAPATADRATLSLNHAAARAAVLLFADLTRANQPD